MSCGRRRYEMQTHDVRCLQQLLQPQVCSPVCGSTFVRHVGTPRDDLHTEGLSDRGDSLTNFPQPDKPEALSVERRCEPCLRVSPLCLIGSQCDVHEPVLGG